MPRLANELIDAERAHRRLLDEAGKTQWRAALDDALTWTGNAHQRIEEELRVIRLEYAERYGAWFQKAELKPDEPPKRDHVHNLIALFTGVGGFFAALLEALLAALLSIRFMDLPWYWAFLVGVGVTIFFAGLVLACMAALVLARYPDRSRATSRPLILILSVAVRIVLVLMTVFFLTRTFASPLLAQLFGWNTALLAIDLPIIAGVLLTLRGLFNWSGEYEDAYKKLLAVSAKVDGLKSYCERELKASASIIVSGVNLKGEAAADSVISATDTNGTGATIPRTV